MKKTNVSIVDISMKMDKPIIRGFLQDIVYNPLQILTNFNLINGKKYETDFHLSRILIFTTTL
ncbi:hypothetical protein [Flagellimonas ochracea]|uniref:hypothetical protein n=1 Tax=Flagellimonas ochracea TaxID=2696472 RepID=UPI001411CDFB|nr:hypothetical protein [Allomuricauda ochracea]